MECVQKIFIEIIVFTENKSQIICPSWKEELYVYLKGAIAFNAQKCLAINGGTDHIHFLLGIAPEQQITELTDYLKQSATYWVKKHHWRQELKWEKSFSVFTYSPGMLKSAVRYIAQQDLIHSSMTCEEEMSDKLDYLEID